MKGQISLIKAFIGSLSIKGHVNNGKSTRGVGFCAKLSHKRRTNVTKENDMLAILSFSWVFFLATKDETSGILQNFFRQIENQLNHRVKIIRSDNGTEFKNRDMLEFCGNKGIKQEYSNARTPQQNRVAERMNRTLIEAARTMLADSLLPTTFWAEAVSTACYIFNRVRVTKPQNKTPYELLFGHKPIISYIRPFGCHVTILDTLSVLGKFDGKCDEGFLVGYSLNSKAFRVYNLVTKKVEVNLHVKFLEEKPNVKGVGYRWMFDIDYLTDSMNYIPVSLENQTNPHAGTSEVTNSAGTLQTPNANASEEEDEAEELIVVPTAVRHTASKVGPRKSSTNSKAEEFLTELQNLKTQEKEAYSTGISEDTPEILAFRRELDELAPKHLREVPKNKATSTTSVNSGSGPVNTQHADQDDSDMPELTIFNKPQKGIFDEASYDDEGMVHDFNNLPTEVAVSPIPTLRIHNIHPQSQILGDPKSSVQTRSRVQQHSGAHALISEALKGRQLGFGLYKRSSYSLGYNRGMDASRSTLYEQREGYWDYDEVFAHGGMNRKAIRKSWCDEFKALMKGRFQMSSIGDLIFFLGLQVKQKTDRIFISQDKSIDSFIQIVDFAGATLIGNPQPGLVVNFLKLINFMAMQETNMLALPYNLKLICLYLDCSLEHGLGYALGNSQSYYPLGLLVKQFGRQTAMPQLLLNGTLELRATIATNWVITISEASDSKMKKKTSPAPWKQLKFWSIGCFQKSKSDDKGNITKLHEEKRVLGKRHLVLAFVKKLMLVASGVRTCSTYMKMIGMPLERKLDANAELTKDVIGKEYLVEEKVTEVKEEEPVIRIGKRKKQKARKGINVDKSPQGDSEATKEEESVEDLNPIPLDTKQYCGKLEDISTRLVMQKYGTNRPEDVYDRVTME
ncbi:putative ribonuclease H-like domain-containing protein [Tanacetum coccineum]